MDVTTLTLPELEKLSTQVHRELTARYVELAKSRVLPALDCAERVMAREGNRVDAIKAYRARTGLDLRLSKIKVDTYLECE